MLIINTVLLLLCCSSLLQLSNGLRVTVTGSLNVIRGNQAFINSTELYTIRHNDTAMIKQCIITTATDNYYCGTLYPLIINCNSTVVQIFQHYGCHNSYEMINFLVTVHTDTNDKEAYVTYFSLPVHILPRPLYIPTLKLTSTPRYNLYQNKLSFMFPSIELLQHKQCSYTILNTTPQGIKRNNDIVLSGPFNRPFPYGYLPTIPFLYNYSLNTTDYTHNETPFLVVRTTCSRTDMVTFTNYQIVSIFNVTLATSVLQLSTTYLHINEMSETIVQPTVLLSTLKISLYKDELKFVFPVKDIGGFYSVSSSNRGSLVATTFTSSELTHNKVLFKPNPHSIASYLATSTIFHYYILNWAGTPLAKGTLHVKVSPRLGLEPSVRKNTGITIKRGQRETLTSNHLDFYPPLSCFNYTVTVVTIPLQGNILGVVDATKKPFQINDKFSVIAKNLNIVYKHNNLTSINNVDTSTWNIQCGGLPTNTSIQVSILFKIINDFSLSSQLPTHCLISLMTYVGVVTPLHVHVNESCRLWGLVTMETVPQLGALTTTPECLVNSSGYPYIPVMNDTCIFGNSSNNYSTTNWNNLWYISPLIGTTEQIKLVSLNYSYPQYVTLNITIFPFSHRLNLIKTNSTHIMNTSNHDSVPYIKTNSPLPLHSSMTSVYITSRFLSVHSLTGSYLLQDIVYTITKYPLYGVICLLYDKDCIKSIDSFTQEDIVANRVYYKPFSNTSLSGSSDDYFQFRIFYLNKLKSIPGLHTFRMSSSLGMAKPFPPTPLKQFWLSSKSEKPLAMKHLRHFQRYFKTKKLVFTLLSPPSHGTLSRRIFTWEDIGRRTVTYKHTVKGTCGDVLTLKVTTNKGQSLVSNFTIAIKNSAKNRDLNVASKGHQINGNEKSFTLSPNDFVYESNFCFEFLTFTITSIPAYGLLRYHDNHSGTTIQLNQNGTFSGRDIIEGKLTYHIFPDLVFFHETEDTFELSPLDPQGPSKRESRSIPTSLFLVYINPESIEMTLNLTIVSPKVITSLNNSMRYGTIFEQSDMFLTDSDFVPANVHFRIHKSPLYGSIQKDDSPIEKFSLQDVHQRRISYISSLFHTDTNVTSDHFEFSVFVKIEETSRLYTRSVKFVVQWCYFAITSGINKVVRVDEMNTKLPLIVSIIGADIKEQASVSLVTVEQRGNETATQGNCTTNNTLYATTTNSEGIDYCYVNTRVTFKPSYTRKDIVHIQIFDDYKAEGLEMFIVELRHPQTCFVPVHSEISVFIVDYADYPFIKFSKNHNQEHNLIEQNVCPIQFSVQETTKSVNITLTRTGNLNQTNSVICYTKSPSSQSDNDYVHRSNNLSSVVTFEPGQIYANCTVNIINDGKNEPDEYFFVKLGSVVQGYAFVDQSSSPVCVFIEHDRADVPLVSFQTLQLFVKERRDKIVYAYFTVIRNGSDLSRETNLLCQVIPNKGNATGGIDYSLSFDNKIQFTESGQMIAKGRIAILPDLLKESNEVFYLLLKTPYNGRIVTHRQVMEIVIIDATETMTIGFTQPTFTIYERDLFSQIPLYRHGDLNAITNVTCILTPVTADSTDYFASLPQTVVFNTNSSDEVCTIIIYDDDIREREETLIITIVTSDPYVKIADNGRAVIIIKDPDDSPIVQFKQTTVYTMEPLSNNIIDLNQVLIPIERTLGSNVIASVQYSTLDIKGSCCYVPTKGTVYFPIGNNTQFISIRILANHSSHRDEEFYVRLSLNESSDTRLGVKNVTRVIVNNTPLSGIYFPTNPLIRSLVNDRALLYNETFYYDLPLICITSCDVQAVYNDQLLTPKPVECDTHSGIDNSHTLYTWEVSYDDGIHYKQLQLDTIFTSTNSKILESFYLKPNTLIKCTATPVDHRGIKGYPRTSKPILLSDQTYYNYNDSDVFSVKTQFETYKSFKQSDQDLVKLTVMLPAISNAIPILTTKQLNFPLISIFTHPQARNYHTCSSLTYPGEKVSFIPQRQLDLVATDTFKRHLLYKHLKGSKWTFEVWLSYKYLTQNCDAFLSKYPFNISMPLHISFASYDNGQIVLAKQYKSFVTLKENNQNSYLVKDLPFSYYPMDNYNNQISKLKFIPSVIELTNRDTLLLVGETLLESNKIHTTVNNIHLTIGNTSQTLFPVYTQHSRGYLVHGWVFEGIDVSLLEESNISFQLEICRNLDTLLNSCNRYSFVLPFQIMKGSKVLRMSPKLVASMKSVSTTDRIATNMTGNHIIQLSVLLDSTTRMISSSHYTLTITRLSLCSNSNNLTIECIHLSNNTYIILGSDFSKLNAGRFEGHSSLVIYWQLDSVINTTLSLNNTLSWSVHVHSNIVSITNTTNIISNNTIAVPLPSSLLLSFTPHSTTTSTITTNTSVPTAVHTLPTYAFILILITVVVLVSVCSVTGVLMVYMLRQKWILKKTRDRELLPTTNEIVKKNKGFESGVISRRVGGPPLSSRRPTTRPVHVITRRSRHRRYSNSSSSSSSSSRKSQESIPSSNGSNHSSENINSSLRRSRSLPTIPSSRELSPADIEGPTPLTISPPPLSRASTLISELQLLPKKERTNVLIATVKPLHHSNPVTNNSTNRNVTNNSTDSVIDEDLLQEKSQSCNKTNRHSNGTNRHSNSTNRHSNNTPVDVEIIKRRLTGVNSNSGASCVPQGVGWYERHQAKQKALEMYSKIYLTNNNDTITTNNQSKEPTHTNTITVNI